MCDRAAKWKERLKKFYFRVPCILLVSSREISVSGSGRFRIPGAKALHTQKGSFLTPLIAEPSSTTDTTTKLTEPLTHFTSCNPYNKQRVTRQIELLFYAMAKEAKA